MSFLAKLSSDTSIDPSNPDFTTQLREGVQQSIDLNTMQLQYQYFKKEEREDITRCQLNLSSAMMRCESVYSDCNGVTYGEAIGSPDPWLSAEKLPFVTRVCPQKYGR